MFGSFSSWRVGLGSNRRSNHITVTTNRGVAHPQYSETNNIRTNDIGILFLTQPVELSMNIFPIVLPPNGATHPLLHIQGMVIGFAGSQTTGNEGLENLQAAHVRTMTHGDCLGFYPAANEQVHFCAEDAELRSNFCLGDQGGPFTIISREIEILVGIASLPGCTSIPSLYTRISSFREWIHSETGV